MQQGLAGFDGDVWFRRTVDLTEAQAAGGATLHLCMIDDCGEAFVNGARVGGVCGWNVLRHHAVPPGVLRAGRNQIAVRVTDTGGDDGFYGDPAALQLETPAGKLPLAGRWKARVASVLSKTEPTANDAPTLLFNGMVQPLLPMAVRGVLWYQGESNVPRAAGYAAAFQGLITDWRAQWGQPNMPIYFVQLASFLPLERNTLAGSAWAELRDAQRQALALPYTGMVVATDLGDEHDIHPKNKQAIGDRLARLALHGVHGKPVVASGPVWRAMRVRGRQIELTFSHQHTGLAARGEHGLAAADGSPLSGFAIADASGRFVPALAQLQGGRVVVSSPAVAQPVAVRYGWVDNPSLANLVNAAGLPASPFRTDHWPGVTDGVGFAP